MNHELESAVSAPVACNASKESQQLFQEAMKLLPEDGKQSYMSALERCPEIVDRESNALLFLAFSNNNPHAAASRLASYWNQRVKLFGDRAFLPMNATGSGALDDSMISILRTGLLAPLPPDHDGCSVFCFNRDLLSGESWTAATDDRKRCFFYWTQHAMKNPHSTSEGVVLIRIIRNPLKIGRAYHDVIRMFQESFPVRVKGIHTCLLANSGPEKAVIDKFLPVMMQGITESTAISRAHKLHFAQSPDEIVGRLVEHQMNKCDLPPTVGGTWKMELYREWFDSVHSKEGIAGTSLFPPAGENNVNVYTFSNSQHALPEKPTIPKAQIGVCGADVHVEGRFGIPVETREDSALGQPADSDEMDSKPRAIPSSFSPAVQCVRESVEGQSNLAVPEQESKINWTAGACDISEDKRTSRGFSLGDIGEEEDSKPRAMPNVFGPFESTILAPSATILKGLSDLEDEINKLPQDEKRFLLQARESYPSLFSKESHPSQFLKATEFNAAAAAQRLATYWNKRKAIFGERAFLPMTQTGKGALTTQDLKVLSTGFAVFLPSAKDDGPMMLFDRRKGDELGLPDECRLRCIFYMLQVASELTISCNERLTLFRLMNNLQFRFNVKSSKLVLSLVQDCFPFRLKAMHLLCHSPVQLIRTFLKSFAPIAFNQLSEENKVITHFHALKTEQEIREKLETCGVRKDSIPVFSGGTWDFAGFLQWQVDRRNMEKVRLENESSSNFHVLASRPMPNDLSDSRLSEQPIACLSKSLTAEEHYLTELEKDILSLDESLTSAYSAAKSEAPELVCRESNPKKFLRRDNADVRATARRLTAYWLKKVELFGQKALLPMDQTGENALSRSEINLLGNGFLLVLPKDTKGRSVICYDGSRLGRCHKEIQLRVAFYMLSIAAEDDKAQEEGIVVLHCLNKPYSGRDQRQQLNSILEVLPLKIYAIHGIYAQSDNRKRMSDAKAMASIRGIYGDVPDERIILHTNQSKEKLIASLERQGLDRQGLPKTFGGKWGYESFIQWQELRTRFEWELPPGSIGKDTDTIYDFSKIKTFAELTDSEKTERKRRMNVLHSRRKRERERIEIEVLKEQHADLDEKHHHLTEQNMHLEQLVATALDHVGRIQGSNTHLPSIAVPANERKRPHISTDDGPPSTRTRSLPTEPAHVANLQLWKMLSSQFVQPGQGRYLASSVTDEPSDLASLLNLPNSLVQQALTLQAIQEGSLLEQLQARQQLIQRENQQRLLQRLQLEVLHRELSHSSRPQNQVRWESIHNHASSSRADGDVQDFPPGSLGAWPPN